MQLCYLPRKYFLYKPIIVASFPQSDRSPKFVCGITKIAKNIYKRSMQTLHQHDKMATCCNFQVVEEHLKLFCDVYIMYVMYQTLTWGGS